MQSQFCTQTFMFAPPAETTFAPPAETTFAPPAETTPAPPTSGYF
jgi:hypothetical protein